MIISVLTPECLQGLLDVYRLQVHSHLIVKNLHEPFQAGFCPLHGSEAALLKLVNDLLLSADSGALITLVCCDLVAAVYFNQQHRSQTDSRGVPQGSVLGPLLFLICMLHIGEIIQENGLHFHPYVDDAQIYITSRSLYAIFFHKQLYS